MHDPVGYYAVHDDTYDPLCADCATVEANRNGLDLDDSELFAPISEFDEMDSPVYCAECGDVIHTTLATYGLARVRESMLEAVSDGDIDRARVYADLLREHGESVEVYVYVSCSEGHEPAETSEPYATLHECAEDMLYGYELFPNIDRIDVEYDGDTIVSAAIDFLGGWFVQVQELDL
jgi:hypothetical protein